MERERNSRRAARTAAGFAAVMLTWGSLQVAQGASVAADTEPEPFAASGGGSVAAATDVTPTVSRGGLTFGAEPVPVEPAAAVPAGPTLSAGIGPIAGAARPEPVAAEPAAVKPAAAQPVAAKPVAAKPVAATRGEPKAPASGARADGAASAQPSRAQRGGKHVRRTGWSRRSVSSARHRADLHPKSRAVSIRSGRTARGWLGHSNR